jgi:hypothetical protein
MRSPRILIVVSFVLILFSSCHDSKDSVVNPDTTLLGLWNATVTEVEDTCDDLVPVDLVVGVSIELPEPPYWPRRNIRFLDYGAGLNCWIQAFDIDDNVLSWWIGYDVDVDCNPGCRVHLESHVDFVFEPGGMFTGVETISYEPLTAECDVPACQSPCANPIDHMLWESRGGRACGFECTTRYEWEGLLASPNAPGSCDG